LLLAPLRDSVLAQNAIAVQPGLRPWQGMSGCRPWTAAGPSEQFSLGRPSGQDFPIGIDRLLKNSVFNSPSYEPDGRSGAMKPDIAVLAA
jgi:hypothetical protein